MAASRRSPYADDPNCGGGGTDPSISSQESEGHDSVSAPASLLNTSGSGQPVGSSADNERSRGTPNPAIRAASSSAWVSVAEEDPKARAAASLVLGLGPRNLSGPTGASDSDSDFDSDDGHGKDDESWILFRDRTGDGASTSVSSLDAFDYQPFDGDAPTFYGDAPSRENDEDQILEFAFWRPGHGISQSFSGTINEKISECFSGTIDEKISESFSGTIDEKKPLSAYATDLESKIMKDKTDMLLANYSEYRAISRDGNCFYRSFIYSYLEQLVEVSHDEELRLLGALEPMWEKFQRLCWPDSYSNLCEAFQSLILECMERKQKLSARDYQDWLFQESQNKQKSVKILSYLRLVTAIKLCSEAERFIEFTSGHASVEQYCRDKVILMGEEAEEVSITALAEVLQVPLQIVIIDTTLIEPNSSPKANTHTVYKLQDSLSSVPSVTLLYRPGHYDIIY